MINELVEVPTIERLAELKRACTNAIERAKRSVPLIPGAVNWGDLYCADATWVLSSDGETGFAVLIEEAAPDADAFCSFIATRLEEQGWTNVEVRTEW